MNTVTIYHNPGCGTSRNTLGLIRNAGIEPQVIEYPRDPPSREQLAAMIAAAGLSVREALREKGTPYAALGLADPSLTDDALLDAMMAHPILINRPFVVTALGTRLCRPSEAVLDILPAPQQGAFRKEDGEVVAPDPAFVEARTADLPEIRNLLTQAGLPVADLSDSTPVRFWLIRDQGELVGTVALERHGDIALLRSLAVRADHRGTGLGRALLRHAERSALAMGIHSLCLLTTTADGLFARLGYARLARAEAPEATRHSEEFRSLCPDSAVCMLKRFSSTGAATEARPA